MPALKRPVTEYGGFPVSVPSKRARRQPPLHRRPTPARALRPVQPPVSREVIYISSTSVDGSPDAPLPEQKQPSGGILPNDSLQDCIVNSIEIQPFDRNMRRGVEHYKQLMMHYYNDYTNVSVDFDSYRLAAPPNEPPGDPIHTEPQRLNLDPPAPYIDGYSQMPTPKLYYDRPIYKATTYNPLIPLAIIRLAEKNLPFLNFDSNLAHLPNVGPRTLPPEFPPLNPGEKMPFLDEVTTWTVLPGDQAITVVFLPAYYTDDRHALLFLTRKVPSDRICSIVCTPCTLPDLIAVGLIRFDPHSFDESEDDPEIADHTEDVWVDYAIAVDDGRWIDHHIGPHRRAWTCAKCLVEFEWEVRSKIALRQILDDSAPAAELDAGLWADPDWE